MPRGTKADAGVCTKSHVGTVPARAIAALPESQALPFRHRCAGCAYELGYAAGVAQGEWNKDQRIKELAAKVEQWKRETLGKGR